MLNENVRWSFSLITFIVSQCLISLQEHLLNGGTQNGMISSCFNFLDVTSAANSRVGVAERLRVLRHSQSWVRTPPAHVDTSASKWVEKGRLITIQLAGVTPQVNLRNPRCTRLCVWVWVMVTESWLLSWFYVRTGRFSLRTGHFSLRTGRFRCVPDIFCCVPDVFCCILDLFCCGTVVTWQ